jgi:hypothetical protein
MQALLAKIAEHQGPSREVDHDILLALGFEHAGANIANSGNWYAAGKTLWRHERPTASLDDAAALIKRVTGNEDDALHALCGAATSGYGLTDLPRIMMGWLVRRLVEAGR